MPSFARIDGTNTVTDIFTLDNGDCLDASGNHSSTIGAAMCEQKKKQVHGSRVLKKIKRVLEEIMPVLDILT